MIAEVPPEQSDPGAIAARPERPPYDATQGRGRAEQRPRPASQPRSTSTPTWHAPARPATRPARGRANTPPRRYAATASGSPASYPPNSPWHANATPTWPQPRQDCGPRRIRRPPRASTPPGQALPPNRNPDYDDALHPSGPLRHQLRRRPRRPRACLPPKSPPRAARRPGPPRWRQPEMCGPVTVKEGHHDRA